MLATHISRVHVSARAYKEIDNAGKTSSGSEVQRRPVVEAWHTASQRSVFVLLY
jgi:hypothetical protein